MLLAVGLVAVKALLLVVSKLVQCTAFDNKCWRFQNCVSDQRMILQSRGCLGDAFATRPPSKLSAGSRTAKRMDHSCLQSTLQLSAERYLPVLWRRRPLDNHIDSCQSRYLGTRFGS